MEEHRPAWIRLSDFVRGQSFIFPVIPLGQIYVFHRSFPKTGQFRRPACPGPWAGQDEGEFPMGKLRTQVGRLLFSRRGQWQIGKGSVLTAEAPLGLPMPDENNLGPGRSHRPSFKQAGLRGRETTLWISSKGIHKKTEMIERAL